MAHRIIAQVVIVGTQVFGKAFISAWKQAAANSSRVANESTGNAVKDAISRNTGLTVEEACQILNIKKENVKLEDVLARHKVMFDSNEPSKGGSFYIQSKVFRAKERLEMEFSTKEAAAEGEAASTKGSESSTTTPPPPPPGSGSGAS